MIGNGACESECLKEECRWDGGDCGCREGCGFAVYGQCRAECVHPNCNYDSHDTGNCPDSAKVAAARIYHLLSGSFSSVYAFSEMCASAECTAALWEASRTRCVPQCNFPSCLSSFGNCGTSCSSDCIVCVNEATCLQCKPGLYQFFTLCVTECPAAFKPHPLIPSLCYFDENDLSPEFYVSSSLSSASLGSASSPFRTVSEAFAAVHRNSTRVLLLKGAHSLSLAISSPIMHQSTAALLYRPEPLEFTIEAAMCLNSVHTECADTAPLLVYESRAPVVLALRGSVTITGVRISGRTSLVEGCDSEFCFYCPFTHTSGPVVMSEGNEVLVPGSYALRAQCELFHSASFISLAAGSSLRIQNVTFAYFQQELSSLIRYGAGTLQLASVRFENVTVGTAVILQTSSGSYAPGTLEVTHCSIQLLNNGFQYRPDRQFGGLLKSAGIARIVLTDTAAEFCQLGLAALIEVANFASFRVGRCVFANNLGSLVQVKSSVVLPSSVQWETDLALRTQAHIHFYECRWENNVGNSLISIQIMGDKLNVFFRDVNCTANAASGDALISLSVLQPWQSKEKTGGTLSYEVSGTQQFLPTLPIRTVISALSVYLSSAASVLSITNSTNLRLDALSVFSSGDIGSKATFATLNNFLSNPSSSISEASAIAPAATCKCLVRILSPFNASMQGSAFESNVCASGPSALSVSGATGGLLIADSVVRYNAGSGQGAGSSVDIASAGFVLLRDLVVSSNSHSALLGEGIVLLTPTSKDAAFYVSACRVEQNRAAGGGSFGCSGNVTIVNTTFAYNNCSSVSAAGVTYSPSVHGSSISLIRTSFSHNSALNGASLVLMDKASTRILIQLSVAHCSFLSNWSNGSGSNINVDSSVGLTPTSYVRSCTFERNSAANACVWVSFFSGVLLFEDCAFRYNVGTSNCVLYAQHPKSTALVQSYISLKDVVVEWNVGFSMIYMINPDTLTEGECRNLTLRSNTGRGVYLMYTYWRDYGSTFFNNSSPTSGSSYVHLFYCVIFINNTLFLENKSVLTAGAITMGILSKVNISNSVFEGNTALRGGAIFGEQGVELNLLNCSFRRNKCKFEGSAMYFLAGPLTAANSTAVQTTFIENNSTDGTVALISSFMILEHCSFTRNIANTAGAVLVYLSTLTVTHSNFSDQRATQGVFLSIAAGSSANLTTSVFHSGTATSKGGAVFISSSVLTVSNSVFRNMTADGGTAISAYTDSKVTVASSLFEQQTSTQVYGGAIYTNDSPLRDQFNHFLRCSNGAIVGDLTTLNSRGSVFECKVHIDVESFTGAAVYCRDCSSVLIRGGSFSHLVGKSGAGIHLQSSNVHGSLEMYSTIVEHSSAEKTGAVLLENEDVVISDCTFLNNSAGTADTPGDGGALYLSCPLLAAGCKTNISESLFAGNSATHNGGAIAWSDWKPVLDNVTFLDNKARYGPDIASFPVALQLEGNVTLESVASGQSVHQEVTVLLIDHYGQLVTTDNSSTADLLPSNSQLTSISGITRTIADGGVFEFREFTITSKPGEETVVKIETTGVDLKKDRSDSQVQFLPVIKLHVQMRACVVGESQVGDTCFICPEGKYSLDPTSSCEVCSDGGVCFGNCTMAPKAGYWRSSNATDRFVECPNPSACLGSPPDQPFAPTGMCREGYYGNLCHGCLSGFSRSGESDCAHCPNTTINVVQLLGIGAAFLLAILFTIKMSLVSAHKQSSHSSIFLKIFVNYIQLTSAASSFNLNWPSYALKFYQVNESAANVSTHLFSFDCFIDSGSDENQADTLYLKTVIIAVMPLCIIGGSFLFWALVAVATRTKGYLKYQLINSIVVLFFVSHPSIISFNFNMFNCKEIDAGEYWLETSLNIRCWNRLHSRYAITVALPSLLLWGIITPMVALLSLVSLRTSLNTLEMRIRLGFLYTGYDMRKYFWEFVIMYRKIVVIAMAVFLKSVSANLQALGVLVVLIISFVIQTRHEPYSIAVFNRLEERSILVSAVTLYCGLFYITRGLDFYTQTLLFAFILLVNAYFLLTWCRYICQVGCRLLVNRFDFLKKMTSSLFTPSKSQIYPVSGPIDPEVSFSIDHSALRDSVQVPSNSLSVSVAKVEPSKAMTVELHMED